jgi:hypothetical protein
MARPAAASAEEALILLDRELHMDGIVFSDQNGKA